MDKKSLLILAAIVVLSGLMGAAFSFFLVTLPVAGRLNTVRNDVLLQVESLRPTTAQVSPTATPSATPTVRPFKPVQRNVEPSK